MQNKRVVVTGGAGFVGSHICERLCTLGYYVVIVDNLRSGDKSYVESLLENGKAELVQEDICDIDAMRRTIKDAAYVFHEAAVGINYSIDHPRETLDINLLGSYNVFRAATEAKVKKVIFASSASVYGNAEYLPMDENHPFNPMTPYCVSKIGCEYLAKMFARQGLKYIALRYFNVYGLRQSKSAFYTSVINIFVKSIKQGVRPTIFGDGTQSMDFINVRDVAEANILAMESKIENDVFNVASGVSTSIKELAGMILKAMKSDLKPVYSNEGLIIVRHRQASIGKIRKALGFEPRISLKDGLKELIRDVCERPTNY